MTMIRIPQPDNASNNILDPYIQANMFSVRICGGGGVV